jgi:predicted MFS family arabinose efflux permease
MVLCDAGRALALGSIPVAYALNRLTIPQLYVVAFIEGTLFVFFNIAEVACLPRVVTPEQLPDATARNQATFSVSFTVGQALGGALFGLGRVIPFLTDAVSYAVSVFTLRAIRTEFQGERKPATRKLRVEIMEGMSWLWHQPLIRFIAVLTAGVNFVYAGGALIAIVLARQQHASSTVIGLMFAIGGLGGLAGALIAPAIRRRFSYTQVIVAVAWLWALLWPLQALAPNPLILGLVIASLFTVSPIYDVVQFSYRLSLIPDELQGRVNSVFRLGAFGAQPLGLALTGWLLQTHGPITTILVLTVPQLALAIATTLNKHVRNAPAAPGQ